MKLFMINPEIWRSETNPQPTFAESLANFYENHSRALWTTSCLLFLGRMAAIYFGQRELGLTFGELLPGPLVSSMAGALLHANRGLDNTKR